MIKRKSVGLYLLVGYWLSIGLCAHAEQIPLKRVVELALTHAAVTDIAAADEQRASQGYRELRANYIPQVTVGSGL
ncbi:MAG: hypothetical protein DMG81_19050, partial [Acidobacteria bacterium]